MAAKAFSCSYHDEFDCSIVAFNTITEKMDDKTQFFNKIRTILTLQKNPHRAMEFYSLHTRRIPDAKPVPEGRALAVVVNIPGP